MKKQVKNLQFSIYVDVSRERGGGGGRGTLIISNIVNLYFIMSKAHRLWTQFVFERDCNLYATTRLWNLYQEANLSLR